jgi:hypothetical protein
MKTKTLLAALALVVAPSLALAGGCSGGHGEASMSCAVGSEYDATSGKCVPTTT